MQVVGLSDRNWWTDRFCSRYWRYGRSARIGLIIYLAARHRKFCPNGQKAKCMSYLVL